MPGSTGASWCGQEPFGSLFSTSQNLWTNSSGSSCLHSGGKKAGSGSAGSARGTSVAYAVIRLLRLLAQILFRYVENL